MKLVFFFLCVMCLNNGIYCQDVNDYTETDKMALNIPAAKTGSASSLAEYINDHFNNDDKKVRAIYVWITSHIKYSTDSLQRVILNEDRQQLATVAFRRKKGVCEDFAAIFDDIAGKCGIASFMVEGYTKQNGSVDKTSHAWCATFTGNEWSLYDPTWDAGQPSLSLPPGIIYFKISPSVFIQSHIPFDPLFQFLYKPVTYEEFSYGNRDVKNPPVSFNYIDSIKAYNKMNSLDRYTAASLRIAKNGMPASMITTRLSQLRLELELIYQDSDSVLYNSAVADYNKAANKLNDLVTYRNNQFKPVKSDLEIQSLIDEIKKQIISAHNRLKELNKSKATLDLDTGDIEYALNTLTAHVQEQEAFFKNYAATVNAK